MKTAAFFDQLYQDKESNERQHDLLIADKLERRLFPAQRDFLNDPARQKVALCPRRAGKSFAVLHYALITALRKPGSKTVVIAKVRKQVKGVYWNELKRICAEVEIKAHYRNVDLECELPNGSIVFFTGADTLEEIEKFRGQWYDLACVDEGKSYSAALLKELIQDVLKPALLDHRGTLVMIGTPGAVLAGPFWAISTGQGHKDYGTVRPWKDKDKPHWRTPSGHLRRANWSLHTWSSREIANDKSLVNHPGHGIAKLIWEGSLADKEQAGWEDSNPTWQREYLGNWVPDEDALVYGYTRSTKDLRLAEVPKGHDWQYALGLDLGSKDDTAFVVAAWADTYPNLLYVHAEKHVGWQIGDIVARTKALEVRFGQFVVRVADTGGLGTMVVESMSSLFGVHFVAAKKSEKPAHIKLQNADFDAGRVQVLEDTCVELVDEWTTLQWADEYHTKEDPRSPNHCADAALYIWRHCYHHLWAAREDSPVPGTPDWWKMREQAEEETFREKMASQNQLESWEKYENTRDSQMENSWTFHNLKLFYN
jgi:hypothetical protein